MLLEGQTTFRVVGMTNRCRHQCKLPNCVPTSLLFDATRPGNLGYARTLADQSRRRSRGVRRCETDAEIVALAAAGIAGTCMTSGGGRRGRCSQERDPRRTSVLTRARQRSVTVWRFLSRDGHGGPPRRNLRPPRSRSANCRLAIDRTVACQQADREAIGDRGDHVKNHVHNISTSSRSIAAARPPPVSGPPLRRTHSLH